MTRLFVNRLTVIDFSYLDAERGMVGESWQTDLELEGSLDEQGMVLDFGDIKKQIKALIDDHFDHKLLIPELHEGLTVSSADERSDVEFGLNNGSSIRHSSPNDAIRFVHSNRICSEDLAPEIEETLRPFLPDNVKEVRLRLWPEEITGAYYHYSHGLKHHCGNCQRIAHGHRARIQIYRNDSRDQELESEWAQLWNDIYIATAEDIVDSANPNELSFSYIAEQGRFDLTLPKQNCYVIQTESTVENIAQHIADKLKQKHPADSFKVYAFEGVDKGAIGLAE